MVWNCTLLAAISCFTSGCFLRPAKVTTRQFMLAPATRAAASATNASLAIGLSAIKLPDYLQRSALAIRRSESEIEYLEHAQWAERLDRSFQRTLAANLESQIPGSRVQLSTWVGREVSLAVLVQVDQFDVNAQGLGRLAGHWQIETPDRTRVLRTGEERLERICPSPRAPEAIAATMSELTAQLAEKLAKEIRATPP